MHRRTTIHPPTVTSISNQDTNVTVPSEPQEAILSRNNSPTADDESTSESSNVGSSQTGLVQEQSSDDPGNDSGRSSEHSLKPDITFPEVTISAFTETGQAESSIEVPLQRASTGRAPIILSILADIPCATLGILGILDRLNTILGTSHTLDIPSLYSLLEECILNNYDFGMAYCRLCRMWYTSNWSTIRDKLRRHEEEDWERRQKALDGNQIVDPRLPPRHVQLPISHAWMDEKDRIHTWTPTNGYEWPVPIPKDANLKLIWIEMLNLGLEYVWLDALCLRQDRRAG
ncbi:uncharacterized protein EV420DRAFT_1647118 [Desarmillaria tabescens]|uniref:Heterokaryon incompatibility domain-containing protein n=1 Tax=Armillaria tabescens TaxID=1929756 RepID=A0AA39JUN2_ARMTA|nr:uncharacterized protein EV420DRAFT_1647118 [Desarmillaria tabescens]KAK0449084.1 hypothetical protein EV420DRAFT_1647118 [Desarmillaria tabescens]